MLDPVRGPRRGANEPPTLFLTVGLPGTGKTTVARQIEVESGAMRLTKDEWVKALYGEENPSTASAVIEGRLIQIGMRALELGINVVIDFGFLVLHMRTPMCGSNRSMPVERRAAREGGGGAT